MTNSARHELAQVLAAAQATKSDSYAVRLPPDALQLRVAGIGSMALPIRASEAKQLMSVASPAQFGRGTETLSDTSVRDTWELTPDQVTVSLDEQFESALEEFRDNLGLPHDARLHAEMHSLLVYGKGQFFLPHQDSEKHDYMVATLVVMLPSVHAGGQLVVHDGGTERTYGGSREDLVLVAFYADCRHEVKPVRSGYRIALTFNLMLDSQPPAVDADPAERAAALLTQHFSTPATSQYSGADLGKPRRLAFLLDREYTEAGLTSHLMKGADSVRVAVLREAAALAGCESVLALAEIRETWDAVPTGAYRDDDYELGDLIEDEIGLGWWIDPNSGVTEAITLSLGDHEVCAGTPTHLLTPYDSEYEGYMGNYGNTVERWYRRAAVVVWPKEQSFAARAEAGSEWALRTILDKVDAGDLEGARADADSLEPFWRSISAHLLTPALQTAAGVQAPRAAAVVLAPFTMEMLTPDHGEPLANLARTYGERWTDQLLDTWDSPRRVSGMDRTSWAGNNLAPLCRALHDRGAASFADQLSGRIWQWLSSRIDALARQQHPGKRQAGFLELGQPLAQVLEAASDDVGAIVVKALRTCEDDIVDLVVLALRSCQPPWAAASVALAGDCIQRLTRILANPMRADDDWTIAWAGCGCADCARLETFLTSSTERTHEWRLAERGRRHIHSQIDAAGLPVRHITRRQGRPYTLVLSKTDELFGRELATRKQAEVDLRWVTSVFGPMSSSHTARSEEGRDRMRDAVPSRQTR